MEKTRNPLLFSKSAAPAIGRPRTVPRRLRVTTPSHQETPDAEDAETANGRGASGRTLLRPLLREWLLDLQVLGRSPRTLRWYEQKVQWYLENGGVETLEDLNGFELKRLLASLQARGLAENTVRGMHLTFKAFGNWAAREGYPADPALLRVRSPKVAQTEMESFSAAEQQDLLRAVRPGWPRLAVQILLGTGMRVSELCALALDDVEDDDDASFLKVRRGKGGKFRRVPISRNLQRELSRWVNRGRAESRSDTLLVLGDGRPASVECVTRMLQRLKRQVGFRVHAHKFRHTFATEYLRRGGEIERLRRILGHATYVMVMRYVHLDKGDLSRDFELRTPF